MEPAAPKHGESTGLWLAKMVTGPLLIFFAILHIIVNHLVYQGGLMKYADVVAYLSRPLIAVIEGCFLIVVIIHSLLGLRSVLLDLNLSARMIRILDWVLGPLGLVAIGYGLWLIRLINIRAGG